jgi:hypothetical protein
VNDERFQREAAGRRAYDLFFGHYKRLHGASLPLYDQLGSASKEVWNAVAMDLEKEEEDEARDV